MTVTRTAPPSEEGGGGRADVRPAGRIEARIRSHLAHEFLFQDDLPLASDESLLDAGVLDSLGVMELVAFLQEEFAVTIGQHEMVRANLETVEALTGLVLRHREAA